MSLTARLIAASLALGLAVGPALAGDALRKACERSPRAEGRSALCACIQQVADRTLPPADQRIGARLILDPERAERIRRSDRPAQEAFWERWTRFGERAERRCASLAG